MVILDLHVLLKSRHLKLINKNQKSCWEEVEDEVVGKAGAGVGGRESDEERVSREANERKEQKKYKLIELVREHPCLYDTAHPEHLNKSVTSVLWAENSGGFR